MFRPIRTFCFLLLAAGFPAVEAGARDTTDFSARIELLPQVTIEHADVSLGEIALVSSADPELQQRLAELPLGRAPQAGETVQIGRNTLMRWIRTRLGIEAGQIGWVGPDTTKILPLTAVVRGEEIASLARDRLRDLLTESGFRSDIELSQMPRDVTVPAGRLDLKVRTSSVASAGALRARQQSVWVDLSVDERFIRTVPVGFSVSAFAPAYVALQDLAAGQAFDPDHPDSAQVAVRDVEWSGLGAEPVKPAPSDPSVPLLPVPTLKLRHSVRAGQPLTHADVATAPLVTRGGYATLRSVNGPIALESRVEVLQDGLAGETVRVKLPKGSSPVLARVTGPGHVEIEE